MNKSPTPATQWELIGRTPLTDLVTKTKSIATRWDALTVEQRRKAIREDKAFRSHEWAGLVERLATSKFNDLTQIQKEAVPTFLKMVRWA